MGRVIPFSEIESYLNSLEKQDVFKGAILDTNILISASYEMRDSHHDVVNLWAALQQRKYGLHKRSPIFKDGFASTISISLTYMVF